MAGRRPSLEKPALTTEEFRLPPRCLWTVVKAAHLIDTVPGYGNSNKAVRKVSTGVTVHLVLDGRSAVKVTSEEPLAEHAVATALDEADHYQLAEDLSARRVVLPGGW